MRADRVLALLLLLQAHGQMTAKDLSERLEVSQRTIYRDVTALGASGVPISAQPGAQGGLRLLDGWRTDLTGLTAAEVEALFTGSAGPAFEQAMGKLAASLPGEGGRRALRIRERVIVEAAGWGRGTAPSPHLAVVQDAVFADRRLRLKYRRGEGEAVVRVVDPLGLVIKAGVWYLLGDVQGARRLFRMSRIDEAVALPQPAKRPRRFDLAKAWREQASRWDAGRVNYDAVVRVARDQDLPLVLRVSGERVVSRAGRLRLRMAFPAREAAAAFLSSFGAMVEVIEPDELRAELRQRGEGLVKLYAEKEKAGHQRRPAGRKFS
jgi:predicted DNA-binding transcriptional regulator YafY